MKPCSFLTFAAILAPFVFTASASTPAPPSLVVHSAHSLIIADVRATPNRDGWRVAGRIEREAGFAHVPGAHLCVEVRNRDGQVISEQSVSIHESPHPRVLGSWIGRASFTQTVAAPPGSTIIIAAHASRSSECRPN